MRHQLHLCGAAALAISAMRLRSRTSADFTSPYLSAHHTILCPALSTHLLRARCRLLRSKLLLSRMRARSCSSLLGLLTVLRSGFLLCPRTGTRIRSSRQRIASVLKPRVVAGCSSENRVRIWRSCRKAAVPRRRLCKPGYPGVAARFVDLATLASTPTSLASLELTPPAGSARSQCQLMRVS